MSRGAGLRAAEVPPVEVRLGGTPHVYRDRAAALVLALLGLVPEVERHRLGEVRLAFSADRVSPSLTITLNGPGP